MTEDVDIQVPRAPKPEFLTKVKFDDFDLPPELLAGLDEAGFRHCTPIQAETLPVSLKGKDIAGQAQTGTGKTAAFLVTMFDRLMKRKEKKAGMPSALIIAPTRELALQVYEDAEAFGKYTGLTMALAIGGIDYGKQADAIRKGPDIVIATPGRIIDYQKQGIFKTQAIEVLVIDEADRLFDLGFIKDIRYLLRKLPHYDQRQTMLFSATLSYRVLELTYEFMNLPEFISVTPEEITVDRIEQTLYHVGVEEKLSLLLGILDREDWTRVLIFVNTKAGVEWVAQKLKGNGLPAEGISGDLPQPKRLKLMEQFKDNRLKILVATDVASRGIHVEDISHVINYDLPQDVENYVHRIGRTARAGKAGKAISFACENYVFHLEPLEQMLGYSIPVAHVEDDLLKKDEAGDIYISRRPRPGARPGGRPSGGRPMGRPAGGRPGERPSGKPFPRERRDGRDRPHPPRRQPPMSSRPGGIFGLAPGWKEALQAETAQNAAAPEGVEKKSLPVEPKPEVLKPGPLRPEMNVQTQEQQATPPAGEEPKKKRRRRRRKKKSPAAGETGAPETSAVSEDQARPQEQATAEELRTDAGPASAGPDSGEEHPAVQKSGTAANPEPVPADASSAEPVPAGVSPEAVVPAPEPVPVEKESAPAEAVAGPLPIPEEAPPVEAAADESLASDQEPSAVPEKQAEPESVPEKTETKPSKPKAAKAPRKPRTRTSRRVSAKTAPPPVLLGGIPAEELLEASTEEISIIFPETMPDAGKAEASAKGTTPDEDDGKQAS